MPPLRGAAALTASDVSALLAAHAVAPSAPAVLGLRGTPTCLALARLLADTHPRVTPVVAAPTPALDAAARAALAGRPAAALFAPPGLPRAAALRFFAAAAVRAGAPSLVLPATRVDAAAAGLGLATGPRGRGGGARALRMAVGEGSSGVLRAREREVPACEMLPPGVLDVVRPLVGVPPEVVDATVAGLALGGGGPGGVLSEVARAAEMLGGVSVDAAVASGERRRAAADDLRDAGDALLRDAVVDVSHWGFVAVCRETLARAYADVGGGGRELAVDVLARLVMHVSGVARELSFSSALAQRLAEEMLQADGQVPAGRTVAGVLLRPATGPSADAFHRQNQRRRGMRITSQRAYRAGGRQAVNERRRQQEEEEVAAGWGKDSVGYSPYAAPPGADRRDLVVLSREPDRESSHLRVRRMGGNLSALPIPVGRESAVYWDNRYVLSAAPAGELAPDAPMVSDRAVLLAALSASDVADDAHWEDATFYVRQMRHVDWEYINSTNQVVRLRNFKAPYQCIRGLPAVYQKQVGDTHPGVLAAAPHLGLSGRPDIVFTAVRLPRFRCIPADLEPGFQVLPAVGSVSQKPRRQQRVA